MGRVTITTAEAVHVHDSISEALSNSILHAEIVSDPIIIYINPGTYTQRRRDKLRALARYLRAEMSDRLRHWRRP